MLLLSLCPSITRALSIPSVTLICCIEARSICDLGTAAGQFRELIVGQAVEEADSAKLAGVHQAVAR
jgi:hypothetical protein